MVTNQVNDIAKITSLLANKMEIGSISFSQCLPCEHGKSANDLFFVKKMYGLYFYTSRASLERLCNLSTDNKFPVYVTHEDTNRLYEINRF